MKTILKRLYKLYLHSSLFRIARKWGMAFLSESYLQPERTTINNLIENVRSQCKILLTPIEAYNIISFAKRALKIPGDMAEVGVFQGGSARLICEVKGDKILHLFDTFEGLPEITEIDKKYCQKGQYSAGLEKVYGLLKEFNNVLFYKGYFPDTAGPIKDKKFCFINIDVDIFQSVKTCMEFFYPRMSRGGVIICHDYSTLSSVREAVDTFFQDKPEAVFELGGTQCLIVKL